MDTQQTNVEKNTKPPFGLIGFLLSIFGLVCFGLTSPLAFFLCIISLFRKTSIILSSIGIVLSFFPLVILAVVFFTFTPPGSIPYPLSIKKYADNAPEFWLDYRYQDIKKVQSQYLFFGGTGGALYYATLQNTPFDTDEVINFAEENSWKLTEKTPVPQEALKRLLGSDQKIKMPESTEYYEQKYPQQSFKQMHDFDYKIYQLSLKGYPFWINTACTILSFETDNSIGFPSIIVISNDKTQMAVYYQGAK